MSRIISVRIEVVIDAESNKEARVIGQRMAERAKHVLRLDHDAKEVTFASHVLYRR